MIAPHDNHDMTATAETADPIDSTEANDPMEPIDRAEPTLPMDSTEFFDPIDRIDPEDRMDRIDGVAPWQFCVGCVAWLIRRWSHTGGRSATTLRELGGLQGAL